MATKKTCTDGQASKQKPPSDKSGDQKRKKKACKCNLPLPMHRFLIKSKRDMQWEKLILRIFLKNDWVKLCLASCGRNEILLLKAENAIFLYLLGCNFAQIFRTIEWTDTEIYLDGRRANERPCLKTKSPWLWWGQAALINSVHWYFLRAKKCFQFLFIETLLKTKNDLEKGHTQQLLYDFL